MLVLVDRLVIPPLCVVLRESIRVSPEWSLTGDTTLLPKLHAALTATYAPYGGGSAGMRHIALQGKLLQVVKGMCHFGREMDVAHLIASMVCAAVVTPSIVFSPASVGRHWTCAKCNDRICVNQHFCFGCVTPRDPQAWPCRQSGCSGTLQSWGDGWLYCPTCSWAEAPGEPKAFEHDPAKCKTRTKCPSCGHEEDCRWRRICEQCGVARVLSHQEFFSALADQVSVFAEDDDLFAEVDVSTSSALCAFNLPRCPLAWDLNGLVIIFPRDLSEGLSCLLVRVTTD